MVPDFVLDALLVFLKNPHVAKGSTQDAKKREWIKSNIWLASGSAAQRISTGNTSFFPSSSWQR
jgi:hypothetical protein